MKIPTPAIVVLVVMALAAFGVDKWRDSRSRDPLFGAPPPNNIVETALQIATAVLPILVAAFPKALEKWQAPIIDLIALLRKVAETVERQEAAVNRIEARQAAIEQRLAMPPAPTIITPSNVGGP